ncbi:MAG: copper amine oxidase N-terminal domain-containing protein [Clostridiales bacterium]|jgi:hypothetical protein|nr:copper amine oxidase N-terminal domain-containing protein [Clostridiales bacterium]MDR2713050.1 copper amine oxidase N-terminal domain-containing protein [Clostridiales bacterium]
MRIFKLIPILAIVLSIFLFSSVQTKASDNIEIYLGGQKLAGVDSPLNINGRIFLPMDSLFEIFDQDFYWNHSEMSVELETERMKLKIPVNNVEILGKYHADDDWHVARHIDQPSFISNNRTYLPLRFIANELNYAVNWDNKAKRVNISSLFLYKNDSWYITDSTYSWPYHYSTEYEMVDANRENTWVMGNIILTYFYIPSEPMGLMKIYFLDSDGNNHFINTMFLEDILSIKWDNDYCYLLKTVFGDFLPTSLVQISLQEPFAWKEMGGKDFSYGSFIQVRRSEEYRIVDRVKNDLDFQIREDGIYTIGYNASHAFSWIVSDENYDLFEESYGYYLIPQDGGSHQLLKKENFRKQKP